MNKQQLINTATEIIKTLPIAHYLKVDTLPVEFSDSEDTSYFDPFARKIVIAFSNIEMNAKHTNPKNDVETEKIVRCFLYHEVSHAILTPKDLMKTALDWQQCALKNPSISSRYLITPSLANIVEDERIETILNGYYFNVDFRWNFESSCPLDKKASFASFEGFVFNAVRHHYSPISGKAVSTIVSSFIMRTKNINATGSDIDLCQEINKTLLILKSYFDNLMSKLPKSKSNQNSNQNQNGQSGNEKGNSNNGKDENNQKEGDEKDSESSSDNGENKDDEKGTEQAINEIIENGDEPQKEAVQLSKDEQRSIAVTATVNLKQEVSSYRGRELKATDFEANEEAKVEMLKIIGKNKGFGKAIAPVTYGYSGKFTAKKLMKDFDDSRKWFEKKSFECTGKDGKKGEVKTLNIWLDNSGSFMPNDMKINGIIKALIDIEAKRDDFHFNLIRIENELTLLKGNDRVSNSKGGTYISEKELNKIYKETNQTEKEMNIVLFDGMIFSSIADYAPLKIFNNKNAIFITETDNYEPIKLTCTRARDIINECADYTERLQENIIRSLDILF